MSIENPISTIRRAIKGTAERLAESEGKRKPKSKHYEEVFENYRKIQKTNPEMLEKLIIASAKDKELKDELGPDLDAAFQIVWVKVYTRFAYRIRHTIQDIIKDENPLSEESKQKLANSINEIINDMSLEIKKDPLVAHSFLTEKEKVLLNKAIAYTRTSIMKLIDVVNI